MVEYINVVISCAVGVHLLVGGLWSVGLNTLPVDGRLQFVEGRAYLAALLNALLAVIMGAVGFRYGRSPIEAGIYVAGAAVVVVFSAYSVRQGKFVLFDLYPRSSSKGRGLIIFGSLFLVLGIVRLVLGVISTSVD